MTKHNLNYWTPLKKGDVVILSDEDSILEDLDNGGEGEGLSMTVTDLAQFEFEHGEVLNLYTLEKQDQKLFLSITSFEDDFDLAVFCQEEAVYGDRNDLEREELLELIFDVDEDECIDEFKMREIIMKDMDCYELDPSGEILTVDDESGEFHNVARYTCLSDAEDPLLLVTEEGHLDNEFGGYVSMYWGDAVRVGDITIFRR